MNLCLRRNRYWWICLGFGFGPVLSRQPTPPCKNSNHKLVNALKSATNPARTVNYNEITRYISQAWWRISFMTQGWSFYARMCGAGSPKYSLRAHLRSGFSVRINTKLLLSIKLSCNCLDMDQVHFCQNIEHRHTKKHASGFFWNICSNHNHARSWWFKCILVKNSWLWSKATLFSFVC